MNRTNIFSAESLFLSLRYAALSADARAAVRRKLLPKNTPQITPAPVPTEAVSEFPTCTAPAITDAPNHDHDSETVLTAEQISAMNAAFCNSRANRQGCLTLLRLKTEFQPNG